MRTCSRCFALFSPALLFLFACPRLSRCALDNPSFTDIRDIRSDHQEKRYDDVDYDSFIGLMGRRSTERNRDTTVLFRPNMNDMFVGLLGRRNTISDIPAWSRERRSGIYLKDRRLRFCCGQ